MQLEQVAADLCTGRHGVSFIQYHNLEGRTWLTTGEEGGEEKGERKGGGEKKGEEGEGDEWKEEYIEEWKAALTHSGLVDETA